MKLTRRREPTETTIMVGVTQMVIWSVILQSFHIRVKAVISMLYIMSISSDKILCREDQPRMPGSNTGHLTRRSLSLGMLMMLYWKSAKREQLMCTLDGNLFKLKPVKLEKRLLSSRMLILKRWLRKISLLLASTQQVSHRRNFLRVELPMKTDLSMSTHTLFNTKDLKISLPWEIALILTLLGLKQQLLHSVQFLSTILSSSWRVMNSMLSMMDIPLCPYSWDILMLLVSSTILTLKHTGKTILSHTMGSSPDSISVEWSSPCSQMMRSSEASRRTVDHPTINSIPDTTHWNIMTTYSNKEFHLAMLDSLSQRLG